MYAAFLKGCLQPVLFWVWFFFSPRPRPQQSQTCTADESPSTKNEPWAGYDLTPQSLFCHPFMPLLAIKANASVHQKKCQITQRLSRAEWRRQRQIVKFSGGSGLKSKQPVSAWLFLWGFLSVWFTAAAAAATAESVLMTEPLLGAEGKHRQEPQSGRRRRRRSSEKADRHQMFPYGPSNQSAQRRQD